MRNYRFALCFAALCLVPLSVAGAADKPAADKPAADKPAAAKPAARRRPPADPFKVPAGTPDEILAFVEKLGQQQPARRGRRRR